MLKRFVLGCLLLLGLTSVHATSSTIRTLTLPGVANWLAFDGARMFALLENGDLVSVSGSSVTPVSGGWSADAPISFAFSRLHGIGLDGELRVLEAGKVTSSRGAKLSRRSGVLALPAGVIAVSETGDLVRLESNGGAWQITARAKVDALQDGFVSFADLEGDGDAEVVTLVKPNGSRYRHGVLGDALEPTAIVAFERHSLTERWRLELPAPFVFEDLIARPVAINGKDKLAVVRSSPTGGAALALVSLANGKLEFAVGPDFGQANRWLNPLVGSGEIYAVGTPHIGGVLSRYALEANKLVPSKLFLGVSSYSIGSRNLTSGLVVRPGQVVLPAQDHRSIVQLECQKACTLRSETPLKAAYSSNAVIAGNAFVIADQAKQLHFVTLER
jgi:hypothetical protein